MQRKFNLLPSQVRFVIFTCYQVVRMRTIPFYVGGCQRSDCMCNPLDNGAWSDESLIGLEKSFDLRKAKLNRRKIR